MESRSGQCDPGGLKAIVSLEHEIVRKFAPKLLVCGGASVFQRDSAQEGIGLSIFVVILSLYFFITFRLSLA
jgi:hypothetical protein